MDIPKRFPTYLLKRRISQAISELLPYFGVTEEELARFRTPKIRRRLKPLEYPEHKRTIPAYCDIENFFHFPIRNDRIHNEEVDMPERCYNSFCMSTIRHEVGHYIHSQINSSMLKGTQTFLRTGKHPAGHRYLRELVAEYTFIALEPKHPEEWRFHWTVEGRKTFDKYGLVFLPRLARMTLDEATQEGIVSAVFA